MRISLPCLLVFSCFLFAFSASVQSKSVVANDYKSVAIPFRPNEVKLSPSWLLEREKLNLNYLYKLDADRLLHNFRVNAGIPSTAQNLDGWEHPTVGLRGHFTGHYLSACASKIANNGDTLLLNRLNYMVDVLAECQQKLGGKYLSAFPESDFEMLEKQSGFVWAPYYTYHKVMQGLLDVYTLAGNKKAYQLVLNMADYVQGRMEKLSPETIEKMLFTPNANPLNEAGAMNEVMHNLYAVSHDPKHLKLAEIFDRDWYAKPLIQGNDILAGLHSNTHIVLVNGFAKRFENTKESDYQTATKNFWEMLSNHHCYANGTSSGPRPIPTTPTAIKGEHWGMPDRLSTTLTDEIAESCVTHNHQKLTSTLFSWTADARFADAYMNTFYNAVLPTQNTQNGAVVYHLPLSSPRQKKYLSESDFRCCNGTGIEAFTHLNSNIYFHNSDNLWVNLFVPSELTWNEKQVKIEQTTDFPQSTKTEIKVKCVQKSKFSVKIFVPSWANSKPTILLNDKVLKVNAKAGSYCTINREWADNDRLVVDFKFDFRIVKMKDNSTIFAIFYGPLMLAFETGNELILKGTTEEILKAVKKSANEMTFTLLNNGVNYKLVPFYKINTESYGVYASIRNDY